ncbi:unnamed protein product, partial [Leptidea sinapis]
MSSDVVDLALYIDHLSISKAVIIENAEEYNRYFTQGKNDSLTLMTQNIRNVYRNIDELNVLLTRMKLSIDIIIHTECWLCSDRTNPVLSGYKSPPAFRDTSNFISSLDALLIQHKMHNNIIIVWDINININPDNNTTKGQADEFLSLVASHGVLPGHTFSTRNNSCLDHILLKTRCDNIVAVIKTDITDHASVLLNISKTIMRHNIEYKSVKRINYEAALAELLTTDWNFITDSADANIATIMFLSYLSIKIKCNQTTYCAKERLIRSIRRRDNLHKKCRKAPNNSELQNTYILYRNMCNSILKAAKRKYERQLLNNSVHKTKDMWDNIKRICNIRRGKTNECKELLSLSSSIDSVNIVNKYFATVGSSLAADTSANLSAELMVKKDNEKPTQTPESSFALFL